MTVYYYVRHGEADDSDMPEKPDVDGQINYDRNYCFFALYESFADGS